MTVGGDRGAPRHGQAQELSPGSGPLITYLHIVFVFVFVFIFVFVFVFVYFHSVHSLDESTCEGDMVTR